MARFNLAALLGCGTLCMALAGAASAGTVTPGQSNWGGYAALVAKGKTFVSATATFVVPILDCSNTVGARGTLLQIWAGLDGAYPAFPVSIEQVGVEPGCSNGEQENPTFYYMQFDKSGRTSNYTGQIVLGGSFEVTAGDTITATTSHSGASVTMALSDLTTGASGSVTKKCPSLACLWKSAEAAIEANGLIATFDTVTFSASSATDARGDAGPLVTSGPWWNTEQLTLIGSDGHGHNLTPCATPGPYDGSGGFVMTSTNQCVSAA
jgi:hypothetical protein